MNVIFWKIDSNEARLGAGLGKCGARHEDI